MSSSTTTTTGPWGLILEEDDDDSTIILPLCQRYPHGRYAYDCDARYGSDEDDLEYYSDDALESIQEFESGDEDMVIVIPDNDVDDEDIFSSDSELENDPPESEDEIIEISDDDDEEESDNENWCRFIPNMQDYEPLEHDSSMLSALPLVRPLA